MDGSKNIVLRSNTTNTIQLLNEKDARNNAVKKDPSLEFKRGYYNGMKTEEMSQLKKDIKKLLSEKA